MFLKWIPQILSLFDFQRQCFLDNLLCRLANAYPTAMFHPFQLSHDQHMQQFPNYQNRLTVERIRRSLHHPLSDQFIAGIQNVCVPSKMLSSHLLTLNKLLESRDDLPLAAFAAAVENCLEIVYGNANDDDQFDRNNIKGHIFDEILPFKRPVRALIGIYGECRL